MDVSDTGLYFAALFRSPSLKMSATSAIFHWWEILPVSRDVVNMEVRWGATSSAISCIPVALLVTSYQVHRLCLHCLLVEWLAI